MVPILKQCTRYIIPVVAGIMYASAVGFSVLHQTGFVGATRKQSPPLGCICHGINEPTPTVNVWISGPETVIVGTTTHYTVSMIGGPAIAGGYNVAAMRGGLSPADTTSVLLATVDGLELTHANPKRFVSDTVRWEFTYQAPANPGQDTLFCVGNSVDFDGTPVGDQYNFGNDFVITLIESPAGVKEERRPLAFEIFQNYPNPFNLSTTIRFRLDHESSVELGVFNVSGQRVMMLLNERKPAGEHSVNFKGDGFASGVYIYKLRVGDQHMAKKMFLAK